MGSPPRWGSSLEGTLPSTFVSKRAATLEVELLCLICRRTCGVVRKRPSLRRHFVGERQCTYGIVSERSAYLSAYLWPTAGSLLPERERITLPRRCGYASG